MWSQWGWEMRMIPAELPPFRMMSSPSALIPVPASKMKRGESGTSSETQEVLPP